MINFRSDKCSDPTFLSELKERIFSLDTIISYQKEEISKSKLSILRFEKCLDNQNEALEKFIKEKEKLEMARSSRIEGVSQKSEENDDSIPKIGASNTNKRKLNRSTLNSPVKLFKTEDLDKKETYVVEATNKIPSIKTTKPSNIESQTAGASKPLKNLQIPHTGTATINKIVVFGNDICIGGCRGLLLKYSTKHTEVYNTDTNRDIIQVEVVRRGIVSTLVGFTDEKILIFEGMGNIRREVLLPGIGSVFNDGSVIYIPLGNGLMKKLSLDCRISDHLVNIAGGLRCFVPGTGVNKSAFVSLQDGLLYVTEKKDLRTLELVEEVTNVKRIMRLRYSNFLCYSDRKIWFFDSSLALVDTVEFEEEIRLVDVTYTSGAVLDCRNRVHVYRVLESGCFGAKICDRALDGDVTALCIVKKNILLGIGSDIFSIENIF